MSNTLVVPLYLGKRFLGMVPLQEGRGSGFKYHDKRGYVRNVFWQKEINSSGGISYHIKRDPKKLV